MLELTLTWYAIVIIILVVFIVGLITGVKLIQPSSR
jgi:hypothetical protein